jgi:hypothetical protein
MAKKTKNSSTRLGRRVIKKTVSRVPARKKRNSNARSTSTRVGVFNLKREKRDDSDDFRLLPKKAVKFLRAKGFDDSEILELARKSQAPRAKRIRVSKGTSKKKPRARKSKRVSFTLKDETKIITCGGKGREVSLVGEFELQKRTMSFKSAPPRVDKLPYQKQITSQAENFFADHGNGTYIFKTRISLQTGDGELVDRWFTPFARKQHDSKESFGGELKDLNLTMQELAKGYLRDAYENYRLEDIEFEYIDASKLIPLKKAG